MRDTFTVYRLPFTVTRGSILILAIWALCFLSTFTVILGYQVRQKISLVRRLEERERLSLIADAAVKKAISKLKEEEKKSYVCLNDAISNNTAEFKEISINAGTFSILYDCQDEPYGCLGTRYGFTDEESKLNINKADSASLESFFKSGLGLNEIEAQELAASIVDWRDADSALSLPLGSAEDSYYRNLQYPYEAKDADFEVIDELLLVKGVSAEIFSKLRRYVTIYGNGKININTAPRVILLSTGLNEDMVEKVLLFRSGEDGIMGSPDDNIFEEPANIVPKISQHLRLSDSEIARITAIAERYFTTGSDYFMARCIAKLNNSSQAQELIIVVDRAGMILYWRSALMAGL
jgi:general secretion pathway protein K